MDTAEAAPRSTRESSTQEKADITMYGNSSLNAAYTIIVANTISLVGTTGFGANYASLSGGTPIQRITLIE